MVALVCGLQNEHIQTKLLSEQTLTFQNACSTALSMEITQEQTKSLQPSEGGQNVNKLTKKTERCKSHEEKTSKLCFRCGIKEHDPKAFPAINWECFVCKKEGHKSKVCRKRKNKVNLVEEVEDEQSSALTLKQVLLKETVENSELSQSINKVNVKSAPVFCKNFVNNVSLVMEVDTGAAVSLICEEFYDKHFSNVPLKSSPGLEAVAGLPISPSGEIPVTCQLKTEFPRVFAEDKRTNITGIEAQLVLKEGASMIFHKAYSVPYKIKDKLEKELKSMIDNGISVRVSHAEMASPIVFVPKPNGAIRVCVYLKKNIKSCTKNGFLSISFFR
jgi:hypothetical protein